MTSTARLLDATHEGARGAMRGRRCDAGTTLGGELAAAGRTTAGSGPDFGDLELADQAEERGPLDLERGRRATAIAGVSSQRVEKDLALELADGLVQRNGIGRVHGRLGVRQMPYHAI